MLCSFRGAPRECPRTSTVCGLHQWPTWLLSICNSIYADDTKLLQGIRSSEDTARLQSDINSASDWSISTDLLFNESKFIHLRFFSARVLSNHPIHTINGNFIRPSSQHKDLGVIFSSDLSWSAHYNAISTKAYQTLGLIRRTFKIKCIEAKKQLYLAIVIDLNYYVVHNYGDPN